MDTSVYIGGGCNGTPVSGLLESPKGEIENAERTRATISTGNGNLELGTGKLAVPTINWSF